MDDMDDMYIVHTRSCMRFGKKNTGGGAVLLFIAGGDVQRRQKLFTLQQETAADAMVSLMNA